MFIYTEKSIDNLLSNNDDIMLTEAAKITTLIKDNVYPKVQDVLSTNDGKRAFSKIVGDFINRNNSKLTTIGPIYQIPFTQNDKLALYQLFKISEPELVKILKDAKKAQNTSIPPWQFIIQNPIFALLYNVIRYFTLLKDDKALNNALAIFVLALYPSLFYKYFRFQPNIGVMQYTIDTMSNRFIIKRESHLFAALMASIQTAWQSSKDLFKNGTDNNCIDFTWRVRNGLNSFMKKIMNLYMENHKKGLSVYTMQDNLDGDTVVDNENDTNKVEGIVDKVVMEIIVNGVNLKLCDFSSSAANISKIELRNYLTTIISDKNGEYMKSLLESILFLYLYSEKHTIEQVNSKEFIAFALNVFKRSNSKDRNVINIKRLLDKFATDSGIYKKFTRTATRVDYTKGIFLYFILCIQNYI